MNCRKNVKYLSATEKNEIVQAFLDLKDPAKAPSQVASAQSDGANSRYDDYVWLHTVIGTGAHRRPGFLAWHRKFVDLLEADLQTISSNPNLALPYWDWSDLTNSNPFTDDFLGGDGDGAPNDEVTTGEFAHAEGKWNINVATGSSAGIPYLQRALGGEVLGDHDDTLALLEATPLDEPDWDSSPSNTAFRNRLEGWSSADIVRFHNGGHVYVGGSMLPSSSPNDPVFFLNHANVDKLWAVWQQKHPSEPYVPDSSEPATLTGHRLGDNMALLGTHFGTDYTIDSVLDHKVAGYMYDTDIPSVTLETPSVDFGNIPAGMTTYHAIRFRVETARAVQFRISAGPSGNFSQTSVPTPPVMPVCGEPFVFGYVFVAYTGSGIIGTTENSSVTIEAYFTDTEGFYTANPGDDYSLLTETIDLFATTVPVQKAAVALVLDRSGSMGDTATTSSTGAPVTKVELLKDAVSVFSILLRPEDGVGVVSYNNTVGRLLDITEMGPYTPITAGSGRAGISSILTSTSLDPRNMTGIGAGILEGNSVLSDGQATANALVPPNPYDTLAMVVMTDGNENQSPTIDDVATSISMNTFSVGLGTAGNVSEVALEKISKNNEGDLLITGDMSSSEQEFFLTKLFIQVLAGITNQDIILDPRGHLVLDSKHRIPFDVTEADVDIDVIALSRFPTLLDYCLETPDGTLIQPSDVSQAPNITYIEDRRTAFYRMNLPALPANVKGSHAGRWHVIMKFNRQKMKELLSKENQDAIEFLRSKRRNLSYDLIVQTRSNLNLRVAIKQNSHKPGAKITLYSRLIEYSQPMNNSSKVSAELLSPDGSTKKLSFKKYEPGGYRASFKAEFVGVYSIRVQAAGRTLFGKPFTREQIVSAAVNSRGSATPIPPEESPNDSDNISEDLCDLLACVMSEKAMNSEFDEWLKKLGINMDIARFCLESFCEESKKDISDTIRLCRLFECLSSRKVIEPRFWEQLEVRGLDRDIVQNCFKSFCESKRTPLPTTLRRGVSLTDSMEKLFTNRKTNEKSLFHEVNEVRSLITEFIINRELDDPQVIVARDEEEKVKMKSFSDENIESIADKDFYTKSLAKKNKKKK